MSTGQRLAVGRSPHLGYLDAMTQANATLTPAMTVETYLDWAATQPDKPRHELIDGMIEMMAPERFQHARMKYRIFALLESAIAAKGLSCQAIPDGVGVKIDARTSLIPDVSVQMGTPMPDDEMFVPNPVIVVEVVSPSTGHRDSGVKLRAYFRVPSVVHYLLIHPAERLIVHHRRGSGEALETWLVRDGVLTLEPPGLQIDVAALFGS